MRVWIAVRSPEHPVGRGSSINNLGKARSAAASPHSALCWFWLALPVSIFLARATASSLTSTDKMAEYWKSTVSVAH